jgi:glycosyltransferase involved in cell wall biosynthesis
MLRICHLITDLDIGGAEMSLFRLLSAIDRDRYACSVISLLEPGPVGRRIQELGIQVGSLGLKRGAMSLPGLSRLVVELRRNRPDVLMTWLYHADLLGLIAGKLTGVRSIVWNLRASDMDMSNYRPLSALTLRICAALSHLPTAVLVNSERGRAYHSQIGYHPREWVLIRNGVDPAQFKPDRSARDDVRRELGLGPEDLLIGLVARFDPMKDHSNFMAAARLVAQREKAVHFALVGKGIGCDNRSLAADLDRPPLAGRLHLLGERFDMPRLTAAFDVACSSSLSEAFPNTVVEAMACGVFCVVTDAGDSAAIVGETGVVVPPGNPDALSQGLLRAVAMGPAKRQTEGQAARERVIRNFGLERFAREYQDFFVRIGS